MDDAHIGRIDLDACDREPIHLIGSIQPHGALLAVDLASRRVAYASENIAGFIGLDVPDVLGRPITEVIGAEPAERLFGAPLAPAVPEYLRPWLSRITTRAGRSYLYEVYAHAHDGKLIVEFLVPESEPESVWREDGLRQSIIAKLTRPDAIDELSRVSADIVQTVTGMDRVMIYRFAPDNHGEVIAESTTRADSFLGLHYPASDIPEPARRHFLLNIIRNIPDIRAEHAAIIAADGARADAASLRPLDLSHAKLRGVSPVHVQYLSNMGVGASLSISLIANGRLWGLIACHHYRPHNLTSSQIRLAELLGATISTFLQSLENTAKLQRSIAAERLASAIEATVRAPTPVRDAIDVHAADIMELMRADGLSVTIGGVTRNAGRLPATLPDFTPLRRADRDGIAADSNLAASLPLSEPQRHSLAGAAILELSDTGTDHLALTRREFIETIRWAGKPEKRVEAAPDGNARLTPRGSFAVWSEERVGHSEPFDEGDLDAARILRRALFALNSLERERAAVAAQRAAENDQQRLRHQLLEAARKSSLGELASALAHELSQPLFAVSNYVSASRRELENLNIPLTEKIETMMSEAVSDAMRAADLVRRIRDFITGGDLERRPVAVLGPIRQGVELALVSAAPGSAVIEYDVPEDLPPALIDHVQISLVILNLVRNALAAMDGRPKRRVTITARHVGNSLRVSVSDTGPGVVPDMAGTLFEPFHSSTTRGMGIGLSLCRSIVEAHGGRVWLETGGEGATFVFRLPIARDIR